MKDDYVYEFMVSKGFKLIGERYKNPLSALSPLQDLRDDILRYMLGSEYCITHSVKEKIFGSMNVMFIFMRIQHRAVIIGTLNHMPWFSDTSVPILKKRVSLDNFMNEITDEDLFDIHFLVFEDKSHFSVYKRVEE